MRQKEIGIYDGLFFFLVIISEDYVTLVRTTSSHSCDKTGILLTAPENKTKLVLDFYWPGALQTLIRHWIYDSTFLNGPAGSFKNKSEFENSSSKLANTFGDQYFGSTVSKFFSQLRFKTYLMRLLWRKCPSSHPTKWSFFDFQTTILNTQWPENIYLKTVFLLLDHYLTIYYHQRKTLVNGSNLDRALFKTLLFF